MKYRRNNEYRPILKLDWGVDGMRYALGNNDIVVVVDTLRFSTAVVTAVANGFTIYPVADRKTGEDLALATGAHVAGKPGRAKYTISPHSYLNVSDDENMGVVLFSPNGAACSALVGSDHVAFVGCLLNARSVGEYITKVARREQVDVTIVAAGEQRAIDDGERIVYEKKPAYPVFAVEDYLASGAIIGYSDLERSSEAKVCEISFEGSKDKMEVLLTESFSGRYLVQNGLLDDVTHAIQLNLYDTIPVIKSGKISNLTSLK